jgi:hypothetical protein
MKELKSPQEATESGTPDSLYKRLELIKNAYLAFIVFLTFAFVVKIMSKFGNEFNIPEFLLKYCVLIVIYYGINKIKRWVVLLVLLCSYWGVVSCVLELLTSYSDIIQLIVSRTFSVAFLCFFVYQIYVFSKKETKKIFGAKGMEII